MRALLASAGAVILVLSASQAEARARIRFRSPVAVVPVPKPAVAAPASASVRTPGSVVVPAVSIGSSVAPRESRARDDLPTSSLIPAAAPSRPTAAAAQPPKTKPVFVCAQDRKVGAGSGFCQVN